MVSSLGTLVAIHAVYARQSHDFELRVNDGLVRRLVPTRVAENVHFEVIEQNVKMLVVTLA